MRLDHLLSKESTARAFGDVRPELGKLLRRARASRHAGTRDPTSPPGRVAPPGPAPPGRHCSVLREHAPAPALGPGRPCPRAARRRSSCEHGGRRPRPVPARSSSARGLLRWLRTAERARASRTKNNSQATKSQRWMPWRQMPMKDVDGCDKPRGAAYQASIRGSPNGETRLGSCPVTPVRTHRAGGGHRGN